MVIIRCIVTFDHPVLNWIFASGIWWCGLDVAASECRCNEYIYRCEVSGFGRSVIEAFALQCCYAAYNGPIGCPRTLVTNSLTTPRKIQEQLRLRAYGYCVRSVWSHAWVICARIWLMCDNLSIHLFNNSLKSKSPHWDTSGLAVSIAVYLTLLLTYLLTYSMEQSPSWEFNRFSVIQ
jgi:hypothetical protein